MTENKDYNFDNFDDTKIYGKHFKEAQPQRHVFSDEFDVDETKPFSVNESDSTKNTDNSNEYGDDFYSDASVFENENEDNDEKTQAFSPVLAYDERRYSSKKPVKNDDKNNDKKKNVAIIALSITLAVVIFIFSLIFFLSSNNDGDKKETKKPTVTASETVEQTETVAETEAETELLTQAETQVPTQAITDPPTQAPTQADVTEIETEFIPEEETTVIIEDTVE